MTSVAVFVLLLATSIWIGGFVAIAIVARVARHELDAPTRIAFFRRLGRRYLVVGGGSLAVALGSGGSLLALGDWTPTKTVAVALGLALALATVVGVIQARELTRMRAKKPAQVRRTLRLPRQSDPPRLARLSSARASERSPSRCSRSVRRSPR